MGDIEKKTIEEKLGKIKYLNERLSKSDGDDVLLLRNYVLSALNDYEKMVDTVIKAINSSSYLWSHKYMYPDKESVGDYEGKEVTQGFINIGNIKVFIKGFNSTLVISCPTYIRPVDKWEAYDISVQAPTHNLDFMGDLLEQFGYWNKNIEEGRAVLSRSHDLDWWSTIKHKADKLRNRTAFLYKEFCDALDYITSQANDKIKRVDDAAVNKYKPVL